MSENKLWMKVDEKTQEILWIDWDAADRMAEQYRSGKFYQDDMNKVALAAYTVNVREYILKNFNMPQLKYCHHGKG